MCARRGVPRRGADDRLIVGREFELVRGLSQVDRLLALTGASGALEMVDLAEGEPAVQALLRIAQLDRANLRARTRPTRLVGLAGTHEVTRTHRITRGVEALLAQAARGEPSRSDARPRRAAAGASPPAAAARLALIRVALRPAGDGRRAETRYLQAPTDFTTTRSYPVRRVP